jgi:predicted dehydrogenase
MTPSAAQRIRAAVVGAGHMGRIHARTYAKMPEFDLVGVVDCDAARAAAVAAEVGSRPFTSFAEIADRVDAVSVVVPTSAHAEVAEFFIRRKIPVLVEKPLAPTAAESERLARLAAECGGLLQVGHSERFNPAFNAIEGMNLRPKFLECRRVSPFSFRCLDVGVVLDLMIHDIDIALHLSGGRPERIDALGINAVGAHEDMADVRIAFDNGCTAHLSASRLAAKAERTMQVFTQDAYVSVDFLNKSVRIGRKSPMLEAAQAGDNGDGALRKLSVSELTVWQELSPADHEPVLMELREFAGCIRAGSAPRVGGAAGAAAVAVAEAIAAGIRSHRWDGRPDGRVGLIGSTAGRGNGRP